MKQRAMGRAGWKLVHVCGCGEGTRWKHFTLGKRKTFENGFIKLFMSENTWGSVQRKLKFACIFLGLLLLSQTFVMKLNQTTEKTANRKTLQLTSPLGLESPWRILPCCCPCWGLEHEKAALGWEKAN